MEEETQKYTVYATSKGGEGHVMCIGEVDDPTEIEIHIGMFARDVVISIEERS